MLKKLTTIFTKSTDEEEFSFWTLGLIFIQVSEQNEFYLFPISLIGTKGTKSKKDVFELGRQSALKLTEQISRHRNHSNSRYNVLPQKN